MSTVDVGDLWKLWKRSYDSVRSAIVADVTAHSDLTEPEFAILIHLHDAGGRMRQNALGRALAWDRTRVSHLVSRMEERGAVERTRLSNGVDVVLSPAGRDRYEVARPYLEAAIRSHLIDRLGEEDAATLARVLQRLG